MRYTDVGGVRLSVIGLGTWQFGSREWGYGKDYAEGPALDITRKALDLGINLIDTAEIYAFGQSERIVGRATAGRRDAAFIATKLFPAVPVGFAGRAGLDPRECPLIRGVSRESGRPAAPLPLRLRAKRPLYLS
jgi:aryl-alcohol dehydrogenase-like predicted oxidoreductase